MHRYKNILIIGTSHIAQQSINEVEDIITKELPDVVALELDPARFHALLNKDKSKRIRLRDMRHIGVKAWAFARIGEYAERTLGERVGVTPGSEMVAAAATAKKHNLSIALIDQSLDVTLKRLSKGITWKEKFRFAGELISAPFSKKKVKFNLTQVPKQEMISEMVGHVKKKYPNVYRVLVHERNIYMAKHLFTLMQHHEKIIAVVGAGHEKEMIEEIKKLELSSSLLSHS